MVFNSDLDYRFLAASQDCDRKEVQRQLEAERLAGLEMRLAIEHQQGIEQRKNLQKQRILLSIVTLALAIAIGLGLVAYVQSQRSAVSEVKAIAAVSEGSFGSTSI